MATNGIVSGHGVHVGHGHGANGESELVRANGKHAERSKSSERKLLSAHNTSVAHNMSQARRRQEPNSAGDRSTVVDKPQSVPMLPTHN